MEQASKEDWKNEIGQFKMERHAPFLLSFKGKYEVDVRGIEDPETREETLKQI